MTKKINNKIIDKNISDNLSVVGIVVIENGKNKVMGRNHWVGQGLETIGSYLVGGAGNGAASNIYIGSDTIVPTTVSMTGLILPIGSAPGTAPNTFNASYSINISSAIPATVVYNAVWNPGTVSGTLGEVGLYLKGYGGLSGSTYATNPGLAARIAVADGTLTPFVINPIDALTVSWFVYFAYLPGTFVTGGTTSSTTQANINQTAVSITNSQSIPVPAGLQVVWQVPVSTLQAYFSQFNVNLNSNLSNMRILYNGQYVPAWIESINNGTAIIWMKTPVSIPANSSIGLSLYADSSLNFDGIYWGEAPQLSPTYGQYDNAASIFNFYDNFKGNTLSSVWAVPSGSNYQVNNGFIPTPSAGNTSAVYNPNIQETSSIIAEWCLNMSSTSYPGNVSYFQHNRYTGSSNMHWLGVSGSDQLTNNGNTISTASISSTGIQVFGIWNNGTTVTWYYEGNSYTSTSVTAETDYLALGWSFNGSSYNFPTIYWVRTRSYPPNGVMPTVSIL
jgi:hypothetical protein